MKTKKKDKVRNFVTKHMHLAGRSGVHEKTNKAKRKGEKQKMARKDFGSFFAYIDIGRFIA